MAKTPDKSPELPKKPEDPARPTRAKAARPDQPATPDALADLLNPAINKGTAGLGSGTGLQPPPDNSFDRRADFSAAHTARKSTPKFPEESGFDEAPQRDYTGSPISGLDPALAKELGIGDDASDNVSSPPPLRGRSASEASREGGKQQPLTSDNTPLPNPPPQGGREQAVLGEVKKDGKYRLPKADLPQPGSGLSSMGVAATAQALENLLREGRKEFATTPWLPHRPPRPEKSEGGTPFKIVSEFEPKGDQPEAIRELVEGIQRHDRTQVLLGVTGSGKTFTVAKVIEATQRPALVLAPNKTLAAQLYGEFKSFFRDNAVEYFVSYYDYYQPEAYVARSDTYIEKESSVNEAIDRMRHSATRALLERDDVIIVASVSCLYGIGSVETYSAMIFDLKKGTTVDQREIVRKLVALQYKRNDAAFQRGNFRVKGD